MSQYIHHVPGRIRVRSKAFRCYGERASKAEAKLMAMKGVRSVQINQRASSIVVQYEPDLLSRGELFAALEDLGCMAAVRRDTTHANKLGETFGKALVGAMVQKVVEQSARSLVVALV
ncbi:MAG: heavy-metal-associated domain-containing protein [Lamprobacter sp.]|uniref:HMA2 domain-containing protein n=1 Tax=Lamprobacter sp. TaxID=3100796 RepID=UPI002B260DE5|nr:heavy-metal-associated domain-containing protein [Lamprobacter sp.]MEA3638883.1 heavy-metal-associated domain-containing protein [Lamprobacter sp.]